MATAVARLATTPTVVAVEVPRELSGTQWCARFPGSRDIASLRPSFQVPVNDFISAIESAGGMVHPNATYRPKEHAYLMEWCWMISRGKIEPEKVPHKAGVLIEWVHATKEKSIAAAKAMSTAYDMDGLRTKPAGETSLHCIGEAIDMGISWRGSLTIQNKDGTEVSITSAPRDGMNPDLATVGASYGVIKFYGGNTDRPHWSTTGR